LPINRVGVLYDELTGIFAEDWQVVKDAASPETDPSRLATCVEWPGARDE
jgi:hypothetical protein